MIVVGGSASGMLSAALAKEMDCTLAKVESRRFPDGEFYARLMDNVRGEDVVLVQNTYPDENFVELLILQDAIRRAGAASLATVVPYCGYARQDKLFQEGEAVSADVMARSIELASDRVILVDIHNTGTLKAFAKSVLDVSGMPQLARYLEERGPGIIISPDKGAVERAKTVAGVIGCQWDYLEKTRLDGSTVQIKTKNLDVSGKVVAITDDIIATGGTIIKATEQLKAQGASRVIAACTHGLFTSNAEERLAAACDEVVCTDTIEREKSVVTVAPEVAKALR